jgi:hypothetical protein
MRGSELTMEAGGGPGLDESISSTAGKAAAALPHSRIASRIATQSPERCGYIFAGAATGILLFRGMGSLPSAVPVSARN